MVGVQDMEDKVFAFTLIDSTRISDVAVPCDSSTVTRISFGNPSEGSSICSPVVLVHVDGDGQAVITADKGFNLRQGDRQVHETRLNLYGSETLTVEDKSNHTIAMLYQHTIGPSTKVYRKLSFGQDVSLSIGRNTSSSLVYDIPPVSDHHADLTLAHGCFHVTDLGSLNGTFVNGYRIPARQTVALRPGDVVQIFSLVLTVGYRFILLNQPEGAWLQSSPSWREVGHQDVVAASPEPDGSITDSKPFYPSPRLMHSIHEKTFRIDPPPQSEKQDDPSALMQLGPSFLMGVGSLFMASSSVSGLMKGGSVITALPTLVMALAMVGGTVIWPMISSRYNKRRRNKQENIRQSKYTDYLNSLTANVLTERNAQAAILAENRVTVEEIMHRAFDLSPTLMNRTSKQQDFLDLRVGMGQEKVRAKVEAPRQGFSLNNDVLLEKASTLADRPTVMDVPVAVNLATDAVVGIIGQRGAVWDFTRGLLTQVCGLYSYEDVKVALLADSDEMDQWEFIRRAPHTRSNDGQVRYIADDSASLLALDALLNKELQFRQQNEHGRDKEFAPFYIVVAADSALAPRSQIVSRLSELDENLGFCLIVLGDELRDLPRECSRVIELGPPSDQQRARADYALGTSGVLVGSSQMFDRRDVGGSRQEFMPDILLSADRANSTVLALSRARIDMGDAQLSMQTSLGFLELFQVGNTDQLNIGQRWEEHDASRSLQTPIGVDGKGQQVILDLHEDMHGPHGLIAGTTGSGKSELIISYILSMCVNYSPDDVSFILIDYKGGGLAGAFDNATYHLPHLAGTITNLDGAAITRSLVSIQSELKRRQAVFNEARDKTGEATMDIYKYISYYRQGVLEEPVPHLFVVADEFAELKQQQPEFMDELISAARIGRSLGLHLILATQKPTGVVNDQIWSNSRFKISLKVADASDSKEMIKRPDAAELTRPGEFYLLVGYNEYFIGGQGAYSGGPYLERTEFEPHHDDAVELIDIGGHPVSVLKPKVKVVDSGLSELNAVLGTLCDIGNARSVQAKPLWCDPLPEHLGLADIRQRFSYHVPSDGFTAVLGMYDDPEHQRQDLLATDLAEVGNIGIYGSPTSGAETLVLSMLCSLMMDYGPDELNIYALDMGAGSLAAINGAPQVGGVCLMDSKESMDNLLLLIEGEMRDRRKLFAHAGGTYESYESFRQEGSSPVPRIVLALTNIATFYELYPDYDDRLNAIAREAPRYGIHLIITASAPNQPHLRLRTTLGQVFVTTLNNVDDYSIVLSGMSKVTPPKRFMGGLYQSGKRVIEFQGATLASSTGDEVQAARDYCEQLSKEWSGPRAKPIPMMPKRVTPELMGTLDLAALSIPVGYAKEGVEPMYFDADRRAMLVLSDDGDAIASYLQAVAFCLGLKGRSCIILDANREFSSADGVAVVSDIDEISACILSLSSEQEVPDVVCCPSIMQLMSALPEEARTAFQSYIENEQYKGRTALVVASEAWRMRTVFDAWYKSLTADSNGVWIGNGFLAQSLFDHPHMLPVYRETLGGDEGFLHVKGTNIPVKLMMTDTFNRDE